MTKKTSLSDRQFILWTTAVYAVIVCMLSCFHEVWRDEMIPMNIVIDSSSPADLFAKIINYGHSGLWYYVLYVAYLIGHSTFVLKVSNVLICIAAIYIFMRWAPFSRLQKILFAGGVLPIYVYPVVNRDYGLSMLAVFLFCILYEKRFTHFVTLSIILFLLANLVAYSTVMVIVILGALAFEFMFYPDSRRKWMAKPADLAIGLILIAGGIAASVITLTPDYTMIVVRPPVNLHTMLVSAVKAVITPERAYPTLFGFDSSVFMKLATWAYMIYLWGRNFRVFLIVGGAWAALALLFHLVWPTTALRHQGAFFLTLMIGMWLDWTSKPSDERAFRIRPLEAVRQFIGRNKGAILTVILFLQVCAAYPQIKDDVLGDYSASRKLGLLLKNDPALKEAIVIPEPDTFGEAFSYYAPNKVFFPREDQYRKYARFTNESRNWFTLAELMQKARDVRAKTGKPVVLVVGHQMSPQGPFLIQFSGMTRKVFTYDAAALADFENSTKKLASFRPALSGEEFEVYLLK